MAAERSNAAGILVRAGLYMAAAVTSVVQRLGKDGHLAAAWRQGADELGQALKAFPDSIQKSEAGTLFNPTQGEIANARKGHGMQGNWQRSPASNLPTPGQIVREHRSNPGQEQERGREREHERGLEHERA